MAEVITTLSDEAKETLEEQAGVTFDEINGYLSAPTSAEIRSIITTIWNNIFNDETNKVNTEPETPLGQLIDSETAIKAMANAELLYLANMFNPRTAEGRWQDAIGAIYFQTRKQAQGTMVWCLCSGTAGTVIPKGAMVKQQENETYASYSDETLSNDNIYYFKSMYDATLDSDGQATILFCCTTTGAISVAAYSITDIVTSISGWDRVVNTEAGILGNDTESRAEFEARRYDTVAQNANGSRMCIEAALRNLDGVKDVYVAENRADTASLPADTGGIKLRPHSVAICVVDGFDDDIAKCIYDKKSAGCDTTEIGYTLSDSTVGDAYLTLFKSLKQKTLKEYQTACQKAYDEQEPPKTIVVPTDEQLAAELAAYVTHITGTGDTVSYEASDGTLNTYRIIRPAKVNISIKLTIVVESQDQYENIATEIKEAIYSDFYGENTVTENTRCGLGETIYASRFSVAVIKSAKVAELCEIKIAKTPLTIVGATYTDYIEFSMIEFPELPLDNIVVSMLVPN